MIYELFLAALIIAFLSVYGPTEFVELTKKFGNSMIEIRLVLKLEGLRQEC